jgi:Uma2 family endonuclease
VRETWLCDLVAERVEVYREPAGGAYREPETLDRGLTVSALALPDVVVAIDALLGPTAP